MVRFRWFHANVKSNPLMSKNKVVHDVVRIKRLGKNGGFNEIKPHYYKSIVAKTFGRVHNLDSESPQVVNPRIFRAIRAYRVRTHGGFLAMTPTREVSVLVCETVHKHIPVAFVESHYINKGMHKSRDERNTPFRNKLHQKHFLKEQQVIRDLLLAGFTVFGGEDTNKLVMPVYDDRQEWVHNDGIDKMWFIPSPKVRVRVIRKDVVTDTHTFLNTDHPVLTATISLELRDA